MIIPEKNPLPEAGSSASPLPSLRAEQALHTLDQSPAVNEDAPPDFEEYCAEFSRSADGTIVSHDLHLNEDGEALTRFLLSQARIPPGYYLVMNGSHTETRTKITKRKNNKGEEEDHAEPYDEKIIDFDFKIDVGRGVLFTSGPTIWTTPDEEPAFRGGTAKEVGTLSTDTGKRAALSEEISASTAWSEERCTKGLPPWIPQGGGIENSVPNSKTEASSQSLRQWADDYCANPAKMKEFVFRKVVYGWNIETLVASINATIRSTGYSGIISTEFKYTDETVIIRPNHWASNLLSTPEWIRAILSVPLIYPSVLLYRSFMGARWEVCGAAYPLKKRVSLDMVEGMREGEWFRRWEETIKKQVWIGRKDERVIREPMGALDGY